MQDKEQQDESEDRCPHCNGKIIKSSGFAGEPIWGCTNDCFVETLDHDELMAWIE